MADISTVSEGKYLHFLKEEEICRQQVKTMVKSDFKSFLTLTPGVVNSVLRQLSSFWSGKHPLVILNVGEGGEMIAQNGNDYTILHNEGLLELSVNPRES